MSEAGTGGDPELDRLAEDWITLWQQEIASLAADPDAAALWRQVMAAGAGWLRPGAAWPPADAVHDPAAAPRPPATAASPRVDDAATLGSAGSIAAGDDPTVLRARIDALEQRLAAIEAGAGGAGENRRSPRRRRPSA